MIVWIDDWIIKNSQSTIDNSQSQGESHMLIFILPFVIAIALFIILFLKVRSLEKRVNRLTINNKNNRGIDRNNSNNI